MNFFGNFFDFKKFFRSFPRAHLFENLRFDIFYRFYNRFSISHFWKFSKKKKRLPKIFWGKFFGFNISFRPKSWAQSLQKMHFSIFYGSGARLFFKNFYDEKRHHKDILVCFFGFPFFLRRFLIALAHMIWDLTLFMFILGNSNFQFF